MTSNLVLSRGCGLGVERYCNRKMGVRGGGGSFCSTRKNSNTLSPFPDPFQINNNNVVGSYISLSQPNKILHTHKDLIKNAT